MASRSPFQPNFCDESVLIFADLDYKTKYAFYKTSIASLDSLCHLPIRENEFARAAFNFGAHNTAVTPTLQKLPAKLAVSLRGKAASQISMSHKDNCSGSIRGKFSLLLIMQI